MNSRAKGVRGERQWRDQLRANGYEARRGQQFSGSPDSPDVVCPALPWAHFEVKLVERLDLYASMEQAQRDSGGRAGFVVHRRNHWPWLVTMEPERLYRLLRVDETGTWAERMAGVAPSVALAGFARWLHCAVLTKPRNIQEAMAEAEREARRLNRTTTVLAHERVGRPDLTTITAETFFEFLRGSLPVLADGHQSEGIKFGSVRTD